MTTASGSASAMMGDALPAPTGSAIRVSLTIDHAKGGHIVLEEDGAPLQAIADPTLASDHETRTFEINGDGLRHFLRADVWMDDRPALIGNPIYLNAVSRGGP